MNKNLEYLEKFFISNDCHLFINSNSKKTVDFFYLYLIEYYCKKHGFEKKFHFNIDDISYDNSDLFSQKKINIIINSNQKEISKIIPIKQKNVIFTSYKIYKIFKNDFLSLNTYNYSQDIGNFLMRAFNIIDKDFIVFITNYPEYIYSEIEKYLVNKKDFRIPLLDCEINHLYEIRNKLRTIDDIIERFMLLKQEVVLKKFNFLTY